MSLLIAIRNPMIPTSALFPIFESETAFTYCLVSTVRYRKDGEALALKLFEKETEFAGCLFYAIDNGGYSMDFLWKLFDVTVDFTGCEAVSREKNLDREFIDSIHAAKKKGAP